VLNEYLIAGRLEAGCDEAGRGCLAGPVVAAAVILDIEKPIKGLNDSKQLTERQRNDLAPQIREHALAWAVGWCSAAEIDGWNILKSSFIAMQRAVAQLKIQPDHLLIDGNRFLNYHIPYTCVVGGDAKYQSIAAASVLAKTYRDAWMQELHVHFPHYGWDSNKGYPSKKHRQAIADFGACEHHRKTFTLLPGQLTLNF
jgi:ribonuclease HII